MWNVGMSARRHRTARARRRRGGTGRTGPPERGAGLRRTVRSMTDTNELAHVAEVLDGARIAILTTQSARSHLVSRPLALVQRDFDGSVWFFTQDPSPKVDDVRSHPQVNVAVDSKGGYLSLSGKAEIVKDPATIDELWTASAEAWFDQGRQDPTVALLHVDVETAEYWTSDEPRAVTLLKYAKAAVTGGHPKNVGDNGTVAL